MKAITLWQPWASLLACGAKKYETRSWATNYRGEIAIHAAAIKPSSAKIWRTMTPQKIDAIIESLAIIPRGYYAGDTLDTLSLGSVIATAEIVECWEITHSGHTLGYDKATRIINDNESKRNIVQGMEILFGDWTPGRYAWEFRNMTMLPEPIPAKGKQRIWNWESDLVKEIWRE